MGLFDWKLHDLNGKHDVKLVIGVNSISQQLWIDDVWYEFYNFNMVSNNDETIIKGSVYENGGLGVVNVFLNCKKKYILFGK